MEKVEAVAVRAGCIYQHYRNKKQYRVLAIGRHTETLELLVVYQGLYTCETYGEMPIWIRPLEMFIGLVEDNGHRVPRFIEL